MADGFAASPSADPSAKIIATDSIGGFDYQIIKMAFGPNDSVTLVGPTSPFPTYLVDPNNSFAAVNFASPSAIYSKTQFVDVTMTTDTAVYASGEVIADSQIAAGVSPATDMPVVLQSLVMVDEDDQGVAMTVYFLSANAALGTENAAPSISDANSRTILGYVDIAITDWKDLGGTRVCVKAGLGIGLKPVTGSVDIYLGIVNGAGTPTFTANGLKARLTVI